MKIKEVGVGKFEFVQQGENLQTLLSRYSVLCLTDPSKKIAGLIHFSGQAQQDQQSIYQLLKLFKLAGSHPQGIRGQILVKNNVVPFLQVLKSFAIQCRQTPLEERHEGLLLRIDSETGEVFLAKRQSIQVAPEVSSHVSVEASVATGSAQKIKVMIVDDSLPIRKILRSLLEKSNQIEIVGEAENPIIAEELRPKLQPDVMTLDISMPEKDGVTYLGELMAIHPMPVIIISDLSMKEASPVMKALELGAFDYIQKPSAQEIDKLGERLLNIIFAAKEAQSRFTKNALQKSQVMKPVKVSSRIRDTNLKLIAIGASTGGTEALKVVVQNLPPSTPPIVIVQHMPPVFTHAFAESLNKLGKIAVKEARAGEELMSGTAYIAPGGKQMKVIRVHEKLVIQVTDDAPMNRFKPSVDYLFQSVAKLSLGSTLHAALLTGMGDDGARGLLTLRQSGAYTIAQDQETCVVWGMPKVASELNAAVEILPIDEIGTALVSLAKKKKTA